MARRRRRLQLIENQRQLLTTYRKRKESLKKKANQLSSLCGVPIAVISFGPNGRLDTWPDDQGALRDLLVTYRSLDPEKRRKHDLDLPTLLGTQAGSQNLLWDPRLDAMPEESLRKLANSLDTKVEAIDERIQHLLEENSKCSNQNKNNSNGEQGVDSKCNDQDNNNTSSGRGDDSRSNNEGNNNTSSEPGLPPCSNPVVFDPFPINNTRNAFTDCYDVPLHELFHGLDQSGRFNYPSYISIAFDPYLINDEASMGGAANAWLPGSSSSSASTDFSHAINSSSQASSSVPSSLLMPSPSTSSNRAFGNDLPFCPPESSFDDFFP
ncbi:transcription factor mef2A-like [Cocos nucifera]|nr:transcription factor mef2A-like [Cocos nucifera]